MPFARSSGVILHPTSLPGFSGIGSLGHEARVFIDMLAAAGMGLWQVLPLGPTGYADSPYSALSAFAGNPLLIALEPLVADGLLATGELEPLASLPTDRVDFGRVVPEKTGVLRASFERFPVTEEQDRRFAAFRAANSAWLEDAAFFLALKHEHHGAPWWEWDHGLRARQPDALESARTRLGWEVDLQCYLQWLFFEQWEALEAYAHGQGIRIIGDIPIFVARDSADVWANQDLFLLDEQGTPMVVAGVPPDYFSATGQLWGNPHYRWDVMAERGFDWWIERFRQLLRLVDIVRLDHFRGFAGAWQVPFGEETAERGEWVSAPGAELFTALQAALGEVPIIAEDLGVITPDVVELRVRFGFPGMHILQFAFGSGPDNPDLPHNLTRNSVVYTGTHDNDTTMGWFASLSAEEQAAVLAYTGTQGFDIAWDFLRLAFAGVSDLAIVPLQDVLRLGTSARMNLPGSAHDNWTWRFLPGQLGMEQVSNLRRLVETYGRLAPDGSGTAGS